MRKLKVFQRTSLDGYFTDKNSDMSWAHQHDDEWVKFTSGNAKGDAVLVFGRITYEMMASYWPTPQALATNPEVAKGMNNLQKVVFSKSLDRASWQNTKLVKGDIVAAMRKMKSEPGPNMVIMGSGTIVSQMTDARLIGGADLRCWAV